MADIARLLDGYRSAVERHNATERVYWRTQRLFHRILDRTCLSDDAAYKAAGAGAADVANLGAYQFERVALHMLVEAALAADDVDDVDDILIRGALVAAQARATARQTKIAND